MATVEVLETNQTVEISETSQTVNVQSGVPDATQLQGNKVPSSPSDGELLRYNGTEWGHISEQDLDARSVNLPQYHYGNRPEPGTEGRRIYNTEDDEIQVDTGERWESRAGEHRWSPNELPSLPDWLRAETLGLSDGDSVGSWGSDGDAGVDYAQGTAADQPEYVASGPNERPYVKGDGTEYLERGSALSALTQGEHAVFAVVRPGAAGVTVGSAGDKAHWWRMEFSGNTEPALTYDDDASKIGKRAVGYNRPDWVCILIERRDGQYRVYVNGRQANKAAVNNDYSTPNPITLFKDAWAPNIYQVSLAEWGVVDQRLTHRQRHLLFDYLGRRSALYAPQTLERAFMRNGAWTWFTEPEAIYDADADKTVVGAVEGTDSDESAVGTTDVIVAAYDHEAESLETFRLHNFSSQDDHSNPAVIKLPSGKYLAAYTSHQGNGDPLLIRRTTSAGDITAWDAAVTVDKDANQRFTYAQLVIVPTENDRLYLFTRRTGNRRYYYSDDEGDTWSAGQDFFTNAGERPYVHLARNGTDRIDFMFCDGVATNVADNSIYHAYLDFATGEWKKSDGTVIGSHPGVLPLTPADVTLVYDAAATGHRAWNWDITIDAQGRPCLAYAEFQSTEDHRYRVARFRDIWRDFEVCHAGSNISESSPYYAPGIAFKNDQEVYCCRGDKERGFSLWRYDWQNPEREWRGQKIQEEPDTDGIIRPIVPKDHRADLPVIYMRGWYKEFQRYRTQVATTRTVR